MAGWEQSCVKARSPPWGAVHVLGDLGMCTHSGCSASQLKDLDKPLVDFRGERGRLDTGLVETGDVSSEVSEGGQVVASLGG